jgi:hypothetical protein
MAKGGVFINYRGEDSQSYGALLHLALSRTIGSGQIFLDSESIPAGVDFVDQLIWRVRDADIVLAVIGSRWLTAADSAGRRRIDNPRDWVRRELVEALNVGTRVIPVLVDGARMPSESELPGDLAALGRCQYRQLRHRDMAADLNRILADITNTGKPRSEGSSREAAYGNVPISS